MPKRREIAMQEIRECIAFYDKNGWDWLGAVTYTGIKHIFGGWSELVAMFRPFMPKGRPRKARADA